MSLPQHRIGGFCSEGVQFRVGAEDGLIFFWCTEIGNNLLPIIVGRGERLDPRRDARIRIFQKPAARPLLQRALQHTLKHLKPEQQDTPKAFLNTRELLHRCCSGPFLNFRPASSALPSFFSCRMQPAELCGLTRSGASGDSVLDKENQEAEGWGGGGGGRGQSQESPG